MKRLIDLNYKNLIRSKWLLFFYGINIFTFVFYIVILDFFNNSNLVNFMSITLFRQMVCFVICFFIGASEILKSEDVELSYPISIAKMRLAKYVSILCFSVFYIIIDIAFVLLSGYILKYDMSYLLNIVLDLIIIDFCFINLGIILGLTAASLFRSKYCYIMIVVFVYIFSPIFDKVFLYKFFSRESTIVLKNLMSVFRDNVNIYNFSSIGIVYDKCYILDKLFIIFLSLLILNVFLYIESKDKKIVFSIFLILTLIFCSVSNYTYSFYSYHNYDNLKDKIVLNEDLDISRYDMDLKIDNTLKNKCKIEVLNKDSLKDTISFNLDSIFNIDSVKLDGLKVDYIRKNDVLILKNINIGKNEKKDIEIDYSGNIEEIINPGILLNFSSKNSSNFLMYLNWYPVLKIDNDIDYHIKVSHKNKLITNLNDFKLLDKGINYINGREKYLYISTGYFREHNILNREFILSEETYNNEYRYMNEIEYFEDKLGKKFKKIIIAPFDNYYREDKDYLVIREDNIWLIF